LAEEEPRRVATVGRHAAVALRNSDEYHSLPLLPLSRGLRGLLRQLQADRLPRSLALLAVPLLLTAVLLLAPAAFRVEARGVLEPLDRRNVYAPEDGDVRRLFVEHNQPVAKDEPLLALANPELELELQRVETERLTTQRRLEAIGILRVTEDAAEERPEVRRDQLSARELESAQLLRSLEEQIAILRRQTAALTVRSPVAGRVLTWDLERRLEDRPVTRGELLLRVADLNGAWLAELEVPDQDIGHVLRAAGDAEDALEVSFLLGTDPSRSYRARVVEIARTATPDRDGRAVVKVKVRVDEAIPERHPGATVVARIDCGYRPLGYVWLHDLIDTVRSRILF
jgi:multidrug efflux pump subunit AcrA (membrane-fusion protein)